MIDRIEGYQDEPGWIRPGRVCAQPYEASRRPEIPRPPKKNAECLARPAG